MSDIDRPIRNNNRGKNGKPAKQRISKKRQRAILKRRILIFNLVTCSALIILAAAFIITFFAKGVDVSAKAGSDQVVVKWTEKFGAQKYDVMRAQDDNDNYVKLTTVGGTKYTDTDIEPGHAYRYKVVSENIVGKTGSRSVTCYLKPDQVANLKASSKSDIITATWDDVKGAQTYHVERKEKEGGDFEEVGAIPKTEFTDKNVVDGKTYTYRITASYTADDKEISGKSSDEVDVKCTNIDPNGKMIALTFDDGPGQYTQELVDAFKEHNAHGTFFVLGQNADIYPDLVKAEQEAGCEVASHTWSHQNLDTLGESAIKSEVDKADDAIKKITGSKPPLLRTPYGATSDTTKKIVARPIIFWSIDTLDWKTRNTDSTYNTVMEQAADGDIVLMHDIHEPTVKAAIKLIPALQEKGFQLVTVSELAEYKNAQLEAGTVYSEIGKKYN